MRKPTQSPAPDPMIGRTIYEFQIEKKLAEGGMGAVYLARHRLMTSTLKVIKVLLPEYAKNPILRQRFHREAEAASKLRHENILGFDNFGTLDDGQLFIMVPYLEGQPLDAYLQSRGGRLSPYRALHLVVQLCDALDDAHASGIIHRDLKPGNVYLIPTSSNPYKLKLLDFGIAKIVGAREAGPRTQPGIAIGTPGYMAVEQYERADEVTHFADVYSLAVMIWGIVAGRPPWQHPDYAMLHFLQRTQIPERPPADVLPAEWAEILLAAMSVEPSARPQSARALAMALASALPAAGCLPSGAEILASLAPHFVPRAAPDAETVPGVSEVDRIGPLRWPPREAVPGRGARWKLVIAAVGTAASAALATGMIATRVSSSATSPPDATAAGRAEMHMPGAGSALTTPLAREPIPTIDTTPVSVPGPARGLSSDQRSGSRVPDARMIGTDAHNATRLDTGAPAEGARLTPRPGVGEDSTAKPAEDTRSLSEEPRRPTAIDPDDVSGPEE